MINLDRFGGVTFSPPYGDGTTTPKYPVMDDAFPSPCGDKLKFTPLPSWLALVRFPSPCGDKLRDTDSIYCDLPPEFSSPYGDKLQFIKANVKINTLL